LQVCCHGFSEFFDGSLSLFNPVSLPPISSIGTPTLFWQFFAACGRKMPYFAAFPVLKIRALYVMLSLMLEHMY
jgi:hypothetical protein